MATLCYPAKAIIKADKNEEEGKKEVKYKGKPCQPLIDSLGIEGIALYRGTFEENSVEKVFKFFKDPFIRKIYPLIVKKIKRNECFKLAPPNISIMPTYEKIEKLFKEKYELELP